MILDIKQTGPGSSGAGAEDPKPAMKVTAMPGKHVPPGVLGTMNDLVGAVSARSFASFVHSKAILLTTSLGTSN